MSINNSIRSIVIGHTTMSAHFVGDPNTLEPHLVDNASLTGMVTEASASGHSLQLAVQAGSFITLLPINVVSDAFCPTSQEIATTDSQLRAQTGRLAKGQMLNIKKTFLNGDGALMCYREWIEILRYPAGTIHPFCVDDIDWTMTVNGEAMPNRGTLTFDRWDRLPKERDDVYARAEIRPGLNDKPIEILLSDGHLAVLQTLDAGASGGAMKAGAESNLIRVDGFLRHDSVFVVDDAPFFTRRNPDSVLKIGGFGRRTGSGGLAVEYLPGSKVEVSQWQDDGQIKDGDLVVAHLQPAADGWAATALGVEPFAAPTSDIAA
jgi:hypothetical protein